MQGLCPEINRSDLELGEKLGSGGYGVVCKATWKKGEGMEVAVKIIHGYDEKNPPREIEVFRALPQHKNIVRFLGAAYHDFTTYLVTELATKGSLYKYLHMEKQTPSVDRSLTWAAEIACGLKHLHDNDVVHRDLKSANILLSEMWVTKICDFGTARELSHTTKQTDQVGTYHWMSPEVMSAAEARINKKSDLFSYGMILFELFAHEIPYADLHDNIDVATSMRAGKRPQVPPSLPKNLHDHLKCCWMEDPKERPSLEEIMAEISKVL